MHPLRFAVIVLAVLAWIGAAGPAHAKAKAEIYRPQHRVASELLAPAEEALAGDGHAVLDPGSNALVIVGAPDAVERALALLKQLDHTLHNVLIRYEERTTADLAAAGAAVSWRVTEGPVRVGNTMRLPAGVGAGSGVEVRAGGGSSQRAANRAGSLTVLEGQTGRIELGSQIPVETGTLHHRNVQMVDATSGLEVTPRMLGDGKVRLEVRPYAAHVHADGSIATSSAETVLVLAPGETAVLGGIDQGLDATTRLGAAGGARQSGRSQRVLLIRAQPE